jgi:NhaC family Na+:H+ antiporter
MRPEGSEIAVRAPSLADALIPVACLILSIAISIYLFGVDAANGPLQVALLLSASVAALVAAKNGHEYFRISEAVVGGVSTAMGAIFILLAVGALIGTWNMSGTTATVVYYGIKILRPEIFYPTAAVICLAIGLVTGSSWTTAGTVGVAFVGMAPVLGVSTEITAGAVISGAYLGDKLTPLSETTILVPKLVGDVEIFQHIRAMLWTTVPAFLIALLLFTVIALNEEAADVASQKDAALGAIESAFSISLINLLPLILLVFLSLRRFPPFLSILAAALLAGLMAAFTQPDAVRTLADDPQLGIVMASVKSLYISMATGFVLDTGIAPVDSLFSRGGMASMLTTIWLVLGALGFAAVMEYAGFLDRIIQPIIDRAHSTSRLLFAVGGTAIGLNIVAGDQYVAIVLPARSFRVAFQQRGIQPQVLSRTVEDTGTVTSVLVPWNSCGAYMTGALGVSTFDYFPYCFLNILNPLISFGYALTGFQVKRIDDTKPDMSESVTTDTAKLESPTSGYAQREEQSHG